jgi:hypothetical protein
MSDLPESPITLNSLEIGWLLGRINFDDPSLADAPLFVWNLYRKLKTAAIANGVEWYYGDPAAMPKEPSE